MHEHRERCRGLRLNSVPAQLSFPQSTAVLLLASLHGLTSCKASLPSLGVAYSQACVHLRSPSICVPFLCSALVLFLRSPRLRGIAVSSRSTLSGLHNGVICVSVLLMSILDVSSRRLFLTNSHAVNIPSQVPRCPCAHLGLGFQCGEVCSYGINFMSGCMSVF